jgi:pimeloyl-ACP methyl ester carboxylesterase
MMSWKDEYWWSLDNLRLHYRDYPGREDRPAILCLPGLTRNARDFSKIADRLAGEWRLICPDLRGRGESAYAKDSLTYVPLVYLQDIERLITELGLTRFVVFGTSLGGILTMLLGATSSARIAGALLNDVGPDLDPVGLDRIRSYVGKGGSWLTWVHAARGLAESNAKAYPAYRLEDWLEMAKRLCRLTPQGRVVFDYDMKIAEPFRLPGGDGATDLWPAFDALKSIPTTVVRGELSDVLSAKTFAEMQIRKPDLEAIIIPHVGHVPTLYEDESIRAIDQLLAKIT